MCKDCKHHGNHHKEYLTTIAKKTGRQIYIPNILLEAGNIQNGDYIEIKIRKIVSEPKEEEKYKQQEFEE
jgi:antitoxin component of MazEF toxin-antitoxin module